MLAKRKSDGKVIEVEQATAYEGVGYWDYENCDFHYPSDLDFNLEEAEQRISVEKLREILEKTAKDYNAPQYFIDEIINRVKESI